MSIPPPIDSPPRRCIQTPAPAPLVDGRDPWHPHVTRIVAVRDEADHVRTYDLVFRDPAATAAYSFAPGQFNMLYLPGIGEAAFSISSDPRRLTTISHTVKAVGNVTQALARLSVGDEVVVRGPFGTAWPLDELHAKDVVIVTGGAGLASVRAAILCIMHHRDRYGRVLVLIGAKTPAGLISAGDYGTWREAGIDVRITVDAAGSGWTGRVGLVTALFDDLDLQPVRTGLLCCGPEAMMHAVVARAAAAGVTPTDIYLAMERNMSCAARLCGLCQFGPEFICSDGPVFPYERIARFLEVKHL